MNVPANADHQCRLGVLAFGDSITNGGGELQWGVAMQSWALWLARGLGMPFTCFAVDGARAADVARDQIPAFERQASHAAARYDLGCLYIGVNDIRAPDWSVDGYQLELRRALEFLDRRCDRILTLTTPLDLGRPRAPRKIEQLNDAIERAARELGALLLDLRNFSARNLVMADHVHPTALGQIAIAERALALLERDGVRIAVRPSSLIYFETTRWRRLRADLTYLYRHAKVSAWALAVLARARSGLPGTP